MSIYNNISLSNTQDDFKPTWLYIKQHNVTGLKYFGKTTSKDPIKYRGSGIDWQRHINEHGKDVSTIWCELFKNKQQLVNYALNFSKKNNIVESPLWANKILESGLAGTVKGRISPLKGRKQSDELIAKRSAGMKKYKRTEEHNRNLSKSKKGKVARNKGITERWPIGIVLPLNPIWKITSPDGSIIKTIGLNQFCKQYNLNYLMMQRIASEIVPNRGRHKLWNVEIVSAD